MNASKVREIWAKKAELKAEKAYIDAKIKELDNQLYDAIPENESVANIKHVSYPTKRISYAKVVPGLMELLTPAKKKAGEALLQKHTSETITRRLSESKGEE